MPDFTPLLQVMKQSAKETGDATRPVQVCFGKVTSTTPLKIQIDQKITLGKAQLVLTRNVTDYEVEMTVGEWETTATSGGGGESSFASHKHGFNTEKKRTTIHNALKAGEEVVLLRQQGGQKYIVLDRTVAK